MPRLVVSPSTVPEPVRRRASTTTRCSGRPKNCSDSSPTSGERAGAEQRRHRGASSVPRAPRRRERRCGDRLLLREAPV